MIPAGAPEAGPPDQDSTAGLLADERRGSAQRSLEIDVTGRGLRASLEEVELGLGDEVEERTRREVVLVVGELAARWLEHRGASEPIILDVWVLEDRVRLEIAALSVDPGAEFWAGLCASLQELKHPVMVDRRRGTGAFAEVRRDS